MKRIAWTATMVSLGALALGPAAAQPGRPAPDDERMQQMMSLMQDLQEDMKGMRGRMQGMHGMGSMERGMGRMMSMMAQMEGMMQQHREQMRTQCPIAPPPAPK